MKNIDQEKLSSDLGSITLEGQDLAALVGEYNTKLRNILDTHAPLKERAIRKCHSQPWFDDQVKIEIRLWRVKEWRWKSDPEEYNYIAFYNQQRYITGLIKSKKKLFYVTKIQQNANNPKEIFNITNKLLGRNDQFPLPAYEDKSDLANDFSSFFINKIDKIMEKLKATSALTEENSYMESQFLTEHQMLTFQQLSVDEVCKLINSAEAKSCELDPIPSKLLKTNSREIAPVITEILNLSLKTGDFCEELKQALLHLLLKKRGLELAFTNYRPVSNLPYLGKIIEWAVCNQITEYTGKTGMAEQYQSAYKAAHSTETALLKVKTDILAAIDRKEAMCLILLDLSAAFDMVNHEMLLNHLKFRFGITDTVLKWIESYLIGRHQSVIISDANDPDQKRSDKARLAQGVPQGSVLGPILFTLYIAPLGDICRKHRVIFHSYTDDQQNYLSFSPANTISRNLC